MYIHISCDMYLRLGLHVQIRLYYVLPYKAKISAQHGIGFILDRCIVYLGLTMPNLQKKRLLIFEIFNINKCTLFFWNRVYIRIHSFLKCIVAGDVFISPSPIAQLVAYRSLVRSPAGPIFFPRIDNSHCDRIHSSFTAVYAW